MLRKIIGIILAMVLTVCFAGSVCANELSVPAFNAVRAVKNGSFESLSAGVPTGWTAESWEGLIGVEGENHFLTPITKGAKAEYLVTGMESYTMYECTFKMKSSVDEAPVISVAYQHYENGTATPITSYYTSKNIEDTRYTLPKTYSFTYPIAGTEWKDMRFTFFMPMEANAALISFGCNIADSSLAFDDIGICKTNVFNTNGNFDGLKGTILSSDTNASRPPFEWYMSYFALQEGIGANGTKGLVFAGDKSAVSNFVMPVSAGEKFRLSYRYKAEFVDKTGMTDDDIKTALSKIGVRGYLGYPIGVTKTIAVGNAVQEGVWYTKSENFTVPTLGDYSEGTVTVHIRKAGDTTNANLRLYVDDVKIEYLTDTVYYYADNTPTVNLPSKGQVLKAACDHYTQGTENGTAVLILCVYEKINNVESLVDFAISDEKTITGGATILASNFSVSMTMPEVTQNATCYAVTYVWESIGGLKPLAEKAVLLQGAA